jgi:hypothetical protein
MKIRNINVDLNKSRPLKIKQIRILNDVL